MLVRNKYRLLVIALSALPSCAWLGWDDSEPIQLPPPQTLEEEAPAPQAQAIPTAKTAPVKIEKLVPDSSNTVEMLWRIPSEPVDGFYVNYGFNKHSLNHQVKFLINDLEKYDHPSHGPVYRARLEDIPPHKTIFFSVAAFRGEVVSQASETLTLPAEKLKK